MKRLACPLIALTFAATTLVGCAPEATPEPTPEPTVEPTTEAPLSDDELLELAEERYQGYLQSLSDALNDDSATAATLHPYLDVDYADTAFEPIEQLRKLHYSGNGAPTLLAAEIKSRDKGGFELLVCVDRSTHTLIDKFGLEVPPRSADSFRAIRVSFGPVLNQSQPLIMGEEPLGYSEAEPCSEK